MPAKLTLLEYRSGMSRQSHVGHTVPSTSTDPPTYDLKRGGRERGEYLANERAQ